MQQESAQERDYNVWNDKTLLGRISLGADGRPVWDSALDPFVRAALAKGRLDVSSVIKLAYLAYAVAEQVGLKAFPLPEGCYPNKGIDTRDIEAMACLTFLASRQAGELVVVYDSQGDWKAGRTRLREENARAALENKGEEHE